MRPILHRRRARGAAQARAWRVCAREARAASAATGAERHAHRFGRQKSPIGTPRAHALQTTVTCQKNRKLRASSFLRPRRPACCRTVALCHTKLLRVRAAPYTTVSRWTHTACCWCALLLLPLWSASRGGDHAVGARSSPAPSDSSKAPRADWHRRGEPRRHAPLGMALQHGPWRGVGSERRRRGATTVRRRGATAHRERNVDGTPKDQRGPILPHGG